MVKEGTLKFGRRLKTAFIEIFESRSECSCSRISCLVLKECILNYFRLQMTTSAAFKLWHYSYSYSYNADAAKVWMRPHAVAPKVSLFQASAAPMFAYDSTLPALCPQILRIKILWLELCCWYIAIHFEWFCCIWSGLVMKKWM